MKHLLLAAVAAFICAEANAAEVTLIAPGGIRAAVDAMIPGFEKETGHKVKATYGSGGSTHDRVVKGEAFDVPVVQPPYQDVVASGNVDAKTETPLATVWVAVAVKKGTPKPDISSADAVKKMLLQAKSIAYPNAANGAAAGVSFNETLKKLGIAEQMKPKIKPAQGGAGAMALVAKGEVDIGLTFLSEIHDPGVDVVGPLPAAISTPTSLVAFVSSHAKDRAAAESLVRYLSSAQAAKVYKEGGMVPGK